MLLYAKFTLLLVHFFLCLPLFCVDLSGIVKDAKSLEPLPFAHVKFNKTLTVTNMNGEFVISLDTFRSGILNASYMGYKLFTQKLDSQFNELQVLLEPSSTILKAVEVMTGDLVMNEVFSRMHLNYEQEAQNSLGYYKEKLTGNDSIYYLAEGILDTYLPSSISGEGVQISPIRTRKKVYRELDKESITLVSGHASDMIQSSIWRKDSFLSMKQRDHYDFQYDGKLLFGDRHVYVVNFEPKSKKGYISGTIYVEDETYAIVRLEYSPDTSNSKFWDAVTWVEEFVEVDNTYCLLRTAYEGKWSEFNTTYAFNSLLVNNQVSKASYKPAMGLVIDHRDVFFKEAKKDFSDDFWKGYNFIKLDESEGF